MAIKKRKILGFEFESEPLYYTVVVAIGYVLYKIVAPLINKLNGAAAMKQAVDQTQTSYGAIGPVNNSTVSTSSIQTVADTVYKEINSFNQNESRIVSLMNSLKNGEEVRICANYYKIQHGTSLRADLEDALDSAWNVFDITGSGQFSALKEYVQINL
ncbi:MAG: hypothetical protein JWN76_1246 [Chitinophagaceae bacterium]|nr:hypothetical protein [Chitinophagaceae bacterium]